ncbi:hypothetical protein CJD36_009240 [Flavipsychrobacter stenotrophus]|uniref:YdhG-like domain-containing protein n=1 Tax=Flavipsychrobacter stenotrophus TaxID=2077091 RepID=A0A2S7SZM4_9BACT|nr:DUF1801 domain-containing protein [Flavipsychrobacter stenotrophus]PQJ11966.1 hypothetical protein CJD36_009240 [Flavipsychrobacter stenotrophus]
MTTPATTPEAYINSLPDDRKAAMQQLRESILKYIDKDYEERITYGMIGYVVPHSIFPAGYHCDPKLPLGYMSVASQKNFIAVYHMGVYGSKELLDWFTAEYPKHTKAKLDMGKSCIRFKMPEQIPYELIGQPAGKLSVKKWIECYERALKR